MHGQLADVTSLGKSSVVYFSIELVQPGYQFDPARHLWLGKPSWNHIHRVRRVCRTVRKHELADHEGTEVVREVLVLKDELLGG